VTVSSHVRQARVEATTPSIVDCVWEAGEWERWWSVERVGSEVRRPATVVPEPPELLGLDHVEFWVANAALASHFLCFAFGFRPLAYAGLETGLRDRASYALAQGEVCLVVTAPLGPDGELAEHVRRHGDGVRTIAFRVPDAERAQAAAAARGAEPVGEPRTLADEHGEVAVASVAAYGDTIHAFVARDAYRGAFLPGYEPPVAAGYPSVDDGAQAGRDGVGGRAGEAPLFTRVDHVVGNVELGALGRWVSYYERVFGFTELIGFSDRDVATEYSALMSKVMADGEGRIKLPLNEPADSARRSQIEEFLDYYGGPGVQHVALETDDIVAAVEALSRRGVRFLGTPASYYDDLEERLGELAHPVADLRRLGILADADDEGHLLQIFTRPFGDRPTFFFELIERRGSRGFGEGNFKALFEAIEREQRRRGNL